MDSDARPDKTRLQDIAFDELADRKNSGNDQHPHPARPELYQRHADRQDETDNRSDEGDEAYDSSDAADQKAEVQPDQRQRNGVEQPKRQTNGALPADEASDCLVDVAAEPADRPGVLARQQGVEPFQHVVPIVKQVE